MTDQHLFPLINDIKAKKLFALMGEYETRFVGGCVRDALLNRPIGDMDMATTATPQQVISTLSAQGVKTIPTGIDHGTVTAMIDGTGFEITTLRKDVETDGRRAVVAFSQDWQEDALRRDFTINAMSLDAKGQLYDYFGGQQDIADKTLRFIGQADARIREDYLRILRFFRFASVLNWDIATNDDVQACIALAPQLTTLSRERIQTELSKLLLGPGALRVVQVMAQHHILSSIIPSLDVTAFETLFAAEATPDAFRRLLALVGWQQDPDFIVLSREQKKILQTLRQLQDSDWPIWKILYHYGQDMARHYHYLIGKNASDLAVIDTWQQPVFPLKAEDIFHLTNGPGVAVGTTLKQAENYWLERQFAPSQQELLTFLVGRKG